MRTVRIQGGLGNQLFGLAFGRSLAILGGDVALDLSSYVTGDRYGSRFLVGDLAAKLGAFPLVRRPLLGNRLASAILRHVPAPGHVAEARLSAEPAVLARLAKRRGYFDGYWQNEIYIHDPEPLKSAVREFIAARAAAVRPAEVALHYRTYKEENHPLFSRTPEPDYFVRAIGRIEASCGPVRRISLLSDDPQLALHRLGDLGREIVPVTGGSPYDDLALLLGSQSLILTNSSFSWWAGYCAGAAAVIYPEHGALFHYPAPAGTFLLA
jgi:hypothetical protein